MFAELRPSDTCTRDAVLPSESSLNSCTDAFSWPEAGRPTTSASGSRSRSIVPSTLRSGTAPGELSRPAGIAVDAGGNVAVADWGNDRIQVLAPDGSPLAVLAGHGDQFSKVAQVFMDARDDLVKLRAEYGAPHRLERFFWGPSGVAFDRSGTLYAADTLRHRVQVYRRAN